MSADGRIRSIAVAGGGIVGLSAALAFARALPWASVRVIELPPDPGALADRMPGTLPSFRSFHRIAGLDEAALVREGAATHRLGTRFEAWSADGAPWYHCYGDHGVQIGNSAFQHQYVRAHREGRALPFHAYAPAAALAAAGKFVHPAEDRKSLLASFDYGLRLDPPLYRAHLRRAAEAAGVAVREGRLGEVEAAEGRIAALRLADGERVEADLFLECAGPAAPLLSAVADEFEDWSEYLPCDRLLLGEGPLPEPSPVDLARAADEGWFFSLPLRSRTLLGFGFNAAVTDAEAARAAFAREGGGEAAECLTLRPGRRPRPWVGNVLALGDAAVAIDPLEATNLHLAEGAIRRALALLPGPDFPPVLLGEYNRRMRLDSDRVRDFVSVHYLAARRAAGAFWEGMAARARPESLARTLEQFEGRGRLPVFEEESFTTDSWLAVLFGLGLEPRRIDPAAFRVDPAEAAATMEHVAQTSARLPPQLPPYSAYLAQLGAG